MFKPPHLPKSALPKAQLVEETLAPETGYLTAQEEFLARAVPTIPSRPPTLSASVLPLTLGYVALGHNPETYPSST